MWRLLGTGNPGPAEAAGPAVGVAVRVAARVPVGLAAARPADTEQLGAGRGAVGACAPAPAGLCNVGQLDGSRLVDLLESRSDTGGGEPQAGAARVVIDRDRVKAKESLTAIEVSSRQAVGELHRLLGFLRQAGDQDDLLAPRPGLSQLPRLAASMSESELAVAVSVEGEERSLPPMIGVSAYRIVQEALTNTLKHAAASRADVRVRYWPDELEVEIIDDGCGATALSGTSPGGLGLIGMRERAALHGGQLTAGPVSGGGFAVRVKLPTPDGGL